MRKPLRWKIAPNGKCPRYKLHKNVCLEDKVDTESTIIAKYSLKIQIILQITHNWEIKFDNGVDVPSFQIVKGGEEEWKSNNS